MYFFKNHQLVINNTTKTSSELKVFLFDLLGRSIIQGENVLVEKNQSEQISTHKNLTKGVYVCVLVDESNKVFGCKIVKK